MLKHFIKMQQVPASESPPAASPGSSTPQGPAASTIAPGAPASTEPPASTETPPASTETPPAAAPGSENWLDSITDTDAKNWVQSKGFKDISSLARSSQHLEKLIGVPPERVVKLPQGDDPEGWNGVYDALGRPKTAAEYVVTVPEGQDTKFADTAKTWFHEAGLSQKQAAMVVEKWNNFHKENLETEKTKFNETTAQQMTELKHEWGTEYDSRAQLVEKAADSFGMTKDQLVALKVAMGSRDAMNFLYKIGLGIPDPSNKWVDGDPENKNFQGMTQEKAKAQILELQKDDAFGKAYAGKLGEQEKSEARARMKRLQEIAFPGQTAI